MTTAVAVGLICLGSLAGFIFGVIFLWYLIKLAMKYELEIEEKDLIQ